MYKQVIVVRTDLGMSTGKICAQVAHASEGILSKIREADMFRWRDDGSPKVVLQVDNEESIESLKEKAVFYFVPSKIVRDAGKTEVDPGTITCIALGPASDKQLNKFTSNLKLL